MNGLTLEPNMADPDTYYAELLEMVTVDPDEALRRYARLAILLANHIGDQAVVSAYVRVAAEPHSLYS